jgi:hypothetical protein
MGEIVRCIIKIALLCFWSCQTHCYFLDSKNNIKASMGVVDEDGKFFIGGALSYTEDNLEIVDIASTNEAFAVLLSSGKMKVWGNISDPALENTDHIYANFRAFAVTLDTDRVVCWGPSFAGGNCSGITNQIEHIYSTFEAFAAITKQGGIVTWGASSFGGDSQSVSTQLQAGAQNIFSTDSAFAAVTSYQYLVCWGNPTRGGSCPGLVESIKIKSVYTTAGAFAVQTMDDEVITWGASDFGGNSTGVDHLSGGVRFMASGETDFIAYTMDSYLVSWGGQGITYIAAATAITDIYSNFGAFVAQDITGKLTIWGSAAYGGSYTTSTSFEWVYSNKYAFVGVTPEKKMICWGDPSYGGNCNSHSSLLVKQLAAVEKGFLAVTCDGAVVTWGENNNMVLSGYPKPSLIASNHRYSRSQDMMDDTAMACEYPSGYPTASPTTLWPTLPIPSTAPSLIPSISPTMSPTPQPSSHPSSQPTSLPTGIPTSVPSCPQLYTHEDGTTACVCKAGYFTQLDTPPSSSSLGNAPALPISSWGSANTTCRACPSNYFSTQDGTETCTQCSWPETTRFDRGNTKCNGYCLCFPQNDLLKVIPPMLFVFILCIALANESKYALGIVLFFPTLDVLSDVLYLTTTVYYTKYLCILSIIFLLVPSIIWVHEISHKKAYPTLLVWPFPQSQPQLQERGELGAAGGGGSQQGEEAWSKFIACLLQKPKATDFVVITISSNSYTPVYRGTPMKPFFANHDGIPHLLSFAAIWIGALLYESFLLLILLVWFLVSLFFQLCWFFLGIFLHLTKLFSIGRVQSFWFYFWTGTNDFFCDRDVDIGTLNRDMLAEFLLESLPQLLVQSLNNQLTHKWTLIGWISAALSMFVALNGTYRMLYWMFWMKVPIDQVQMGMALKILGAKPELRHKPTDENGLESGENGISLTAPRRPSGSKIAPLTIETPPQEGTSILPFSSVKQTVTPRDRSQLETSSAAGCEMKIQEVSTPDHPGGPFDHLSDENEAKWRGNIWQLLTSEDNSLDRGLTQKKMASVGLGSEAEIRYMNEKDIEMIGSTLKAVPRRKLRFLWGGRLVKTHAYLPALVGEGGEGEGDEGLESREPSTLVFNEQQWQHAEAGDSQV